MTYFEVAFRYSGTATFVLAAETADAAVRAARDRWYDGELGNDTGQALQKIDDDTLTVKEVKK